jgi:hypothetical protein
MRSFLLVLAIATAGFVSLGVSFHESLAQVATKQGRTLWTPSCDRGGGGIFIPTSPDESRCLTQCVSNEDGEDYRVYQFYCLEQYDEDQCNAAIANLFISPQCDARCCGPLPGVQPPGEIA